MSQKKFIIDGGFQTDEPSVIQAELDMDNNKIVNVDTPVSGLDAVNKDYVDNEISTINSTIASSSSSDVKADTFVYSGYRSGTATLYTGFSVGKYIHFVPGQSQASSGTFTNGSFFSGPNYGTNMRYMAIAVRTG